MIDHLLSSFPLTTALTASSSPRDMPEPCVTPQPPLTVVPSAILGYLRNSTKKKPEIFKNPSKRPSGFRETESNSSDAFRFSTLFGFLVYSQGAILFGCHITYKGPAQNRRRPRLHNGLDTSDLELSEMSQNQEGIFLEQYVHVTTTTPTIFREMKRVTVKTEIYSPFQLLSVVGWCLVGANRIEPLVMILDLTPHF